MDAQEKSSKGKWRRILWVVAGLAVLAGGTLIALNFSASTADGANTPGEQTADAGEPADADGTENGEKNGEPDEGDGEDGEDEDEKAPIPVEVATVESRPVSAYIRSSANLVAENQVKVLSEVEGRVARLEVEEGDFVRKGEVLGEVTIHPHKDQPLLLEFDGDDWIVP